MALSPSSRPFSARISSPSNQIGLDCRGAGIILEQNSPAVEPGEVQMGNVGFKVFALDTTLELPEDTTKADLLKAMEGHILAQGELMGIYGR